jgi:hypothetical protein
MKLQRSTLLMIRSACDRLLAPALAATMSCGLLLSGCGGGAEGTGGSSIGIETKIDAIPGEEVAGLCADIQSRSFDRLFSTDTNCTYAALSTPGFFLRNEEDGIYTPPTDDASIIRDCRIANQACTEDPPDFLVATTDHCGGSTPNCILDDEDFRANCPAPLALLLACLDEEAANAAQVNDRLSCDAAAAFARGEVDFQGTLPRPNCEAIRSMCGEFAVSFSPCGTTFSRVITIDCGDDGLCE